MPEPPRSSRDEERESKNEERGASNEERDGMGSLASLPSLPLLVSRFPLLVSRFSHSWQRVRDRAEDAGVGHRDLPQRSIGRRQHQRAFAGKDVPAFLQIARILALDRGARLYFIRHVILRQRFWQIHAIGPCRRRETISSKHVPPP